MKTISSWIVFVLTLMCCTFAQTTFSDTDAAQSPLRSVERVHDLVVMIDSDVGIGAGIIFGRKNNRIFIATANHVVRKGPRVAQNVKVQFKTSPGKWLSATVTPDYEAHRDTDLAVLSVEGFKSNGTDFCMLPLERLAQHNTLQRGDKVFPVGYPHGAPWASPILPDVVADAAGQLISFQSSFIEVGTSGGALINDQGELVGLIKNDRPPFGVAVKLHKILETLRKWQYPVQLYNKNQRVTGAALHAAVKRGDMDEITQLLDDCYGIDEADSQGKTALQLAVATGPLELVNFLLAKGAKKDIAENTTSLLHLATEGGQAEIVALLLSRGAEVNAAFADGTTPLHLAAKNGNLEIARLLIKKGADLYARRSEKSTTYYGNGIRTPLHSAAAHGQAKVVTLLLESGVNVDVRAYDTHGKTPLHLAALYGQREVVEILLKAGASVNVSSHINPKSYTPLFMAIGTNNDVEIGHSVEIARMLIAKGADITNSGNYEKNTLLHIAAKAGRKEIVKFLLESGAEINSKNKRDETPLHLAVSPERDSAPGPKHIGTLKTLIALGADVNAINSSKETPLHLAAKTGPKEVLEILLQAGADKNTINQYSLSPLHEAVKARKPENVRTLLDAGADPNTGPPATKKPLHDALRDADVQMVKELLAAGAYVNAMAPFSGKTPLCWTMKYLSFSDSSWVKKRPQLMEIARILLEGGANTYIPCSKGKMPVDMAADWEDLQKRIRSIQEPIVRRLNKGRTTHVSQNEGNPEVFIQSGHSGSIKAAAFSPDGRYIVSGGTDNTLKLWDAGSKRQISTFMGHAGAIRSVSFSPDGKHIISGSEDKTVRIWEVGTGRVIHTLKHSLPVSSVAYSPDGNRIASAGYGLGDSLKIWDARTGLNVWEAGDQQEGEKIQVKSTKYYKSVIFSPDNRHIATSRIRGGVELWDVATGQRKNHWQHEDSVAFSPDGRVIVVGSENLLKILDVQNGHELRHLRRKQGHRINAVAISPDSRIVVVGDRYRSTHARLTAWEMETGKLIHNKSIDHVVDSIMYSPDGHYVLPSGGNMRALKLWSVPAGQEKVIFAPHSIPIHKVAFSSDRQSVVAVGYDDKSLQAFQIGADGKIHAKKLLPLEDEESKPIRAVALSSNGQYIASGYDYGGKLNLWNIKSGCELHTLDAAGNIRALSFSPDGRYLASMGSDLILWDVSTRLLKRTLYQSPVSALAVTAGGRYVAGVSRFRERVKLWDMETGVNRFFEGLDPDFSTLAFSPDGSHLALGGEKTVLKQWELNTGREIQALGMPPVYSVAYSPDGRYLLSAADGRMVLWEMKTDRMVQVFQGHVGRVNSVAFSPDGRNIVSGGEDGTVRIWNTETGKEILQVALFDDGEWITKTPEGFYIASPKGEDRLNVRIGRDVFDIAKFRKTFNKPDIVKTAFDMAEPYEH